MRILGGAARFAGACPRGDFQFRCCVAGPPRYPDTGSNQPLFFDFGKQGSARPLSDHKKRLHDQPVRNGGYGATPYWEDRK